VKTRGLYAVIGVVLVGLVFAGVAWGEPVVYVDDDFNSGTPGWGVTHFDNLPGAVGAADPSGLVQVYDGTYDQVSQLVVPKPLTIQSGTPGVQPTLSFADGQWDGVSVQADHVTLEGLRLYRAGHTHYNALVGVPKGGPYPNYVVQYEDTILRGCTLEGGRYGAYVHARDLTVDGCTFQDNYRDGLVLAGLEGTTTVTGNHFTGDAGSKKAILIEGGVEYPHVQGTLNIDYNTCSGKRNFMVFNHWGFDADPLALNVVHNSIYGAAGAALAFYAAYTDDPDGFDKFSSIAIRDNIISNADGLAVMVDYEDWGGAPPADNRPVPDNGQIAVSYALSHANTYDPLMEMADATGNFGYYNVAAMTPGDASMLMYSLLSNSTGDPLFTDPANGDFSLLAGSPALGVASDGTNIGAWQSDGTPIPEPISMIFFGTGVVGVFGFVSRRKMHKG